MSSRVPAIPGTGKPGRAALTWPRLPDYVVTRAVSTIPTTPGEPIQLGESRAVIIAVGQFTGVSVANKPTTAINTFDLRAARGVPLPQRFRWLRESASSGSVTLLGWELCEGESLADLAALVSGIADANATANASDLPTKNFARTATIPGGGTGTYTWQLGGFMYATVKARATNVGTTSIGESVAQANIQLAPGAAISGIVGDGLVFGFSGTNGDVLEVLEFGRP